MSNNNSKLNNNKTWDNILIRFACHFIKNPQNSICPNAAMKYETQYWKETKLTVKNQLESYTVKNEILWAIDVKKKN